MKSDSTIRVFVGADDSQLVAAQVLKYTLIRHSSRPIDYHIMLQPTYNMPKEVKNQPRTGFSFNRFNIPKLCNYQGKAIYLDADMLVFGDIAEIWDLPFNNKHLLSTDRQFSVLLLDCSSLDWDVNSLICQLDSGQLSYEELMFDFAHMPADLIGFSIPKAWNSLEEYKDGKTKLLHYTVGRNQPWISRRNQLESIWVQELKSALKAGVVDPKCLLDGIKKGRLHPYLAQYIHARAPFLQYAIHRVMRAVSRRMRVA